MQDNVTADKEIKYTAFAVFAPPSGFCERGGEIRSANGVETTDYLYTGQRNESELGLDWYVAWFRELCAPDRSL